MFVVDKEVLLDRWGLQADAVLVVVFVADAPAA